MSEKKARSSKAAGGGSGVGHGGGGGGSSGLFRLKFRKPESRSRSAQRPCEMSSTESGGVGAGGSVGSLGSGSTGLLDPHQVSVHLWGNDEVAAWLESLHLEEYREDFIKHDIRGPELLTLERRDLKELGIHKVGHIKRIQQAILEIRELARSQPAS